MKRLTFPLPPALVAVAALGVLLVSSGVAQAQMPYKIQKIARLGERAGDTLLPASYDIVPGALNDSGQLLFDVVTPGGDLLFQYADGQFTLIAAPERDGPIGKWPKQFAVNPFRLSINQSGDVVFAAYRLPSYPTAFGTFLWEAKARTLTPLVLKDMPATGDLSFSIPGGNAPAINNPGDIVLIGSVKGPTSPAGYGLFFLGRDHQLRPILLTGQELPGGGKAASSHAYLPSITDSGAVAFLAQRQGRQGESSFSVYRWEQGALTSLLLAGTDVPGVGKIVGVSPESGSVVANNKNHDVLITARVSGSSVEGRYRVSDGKVFPVAVPGQEMPGGGKLKSTSGGGQASQAGEYAFWAKLDDGATAVYQVDAVGNLSLVLKSGTRTELGTITRIETASQAVVNSKGQVALTVQIDNGPDTLVLLTPTAQ